MEINQHCQEFCVFATLGHCGRTEFEYLNHCEKLWYNNELQRADIKRNDIKVEKTVLESTGKQIDPKWKIIIEQGDPIIIGDTNETIMATLSTFMAG